MVVCSAMGYIEVRDGPEEATVHSPWWEAKTQSIREALFRNLFVTANEMFNHHHCSIPTFPIFWKKCMFVCDFSPLTFCETFRYGEQQKTKDPLCHLLRLPCLELLVILSQVLELRWIMGFGFQLHNVFLVTSKTKTKDSCSILDFYGYITIRAPVGTDNIW